MSGSRRDFFEEGRDGSLPLASEKSLNVRFEGLKAIVMVFDRAIFCFCTEGCVRDSSKNMFGRREAAKLNPSHVSVSVNKLPFLYLNSFQRQAIFIDVYFITFCS